MERDRYYPLNTYFRRVFGEKVYKLSLAGGFTCPVRDGSLSAEGCVFCNPLGNVPRHYQPGMTLPEQLEKASRYVEKRHGVRSFIAYFQDYTTTYGDIRGMERMFREALDFPGVKGLALCTRPDCLSAEVLELLERISRETFLWVELGVQSGCDVTLLRMRRGHTVYDSEKAFDSLHSRGIRTSAHVILGFPGESREEALATTELIRKSGTAGVKIQNLHVLEDTELARMYRTGSIQLIRRSEYASLAADFLERIPPDLVIQRLTGEAPPGLLVAPEWARNKLAVLQRVGRELLYRDSWQGKLLGAALEDIPSLEQ